jgi:hypothetical protein
MNRHQSPHRPGDGDLTALRRRQARKEGNAMQGLAKDYGERVWTVFNAVAVLFCLYYLFGGGKEHDALGYVVVALLLVLCGKQWRDGGRWILRQLA